ncbi:MAG: histidine kinase [Bacteroidales bacterium]|nr:histidine kinase [Bacteroidales bacterium]
MNDRKNHIIIHSFALMHLVVALGCRLIGVADDLMLTLLTMLLIVMICFRCRSSAVFMAVSVILVNIVGVILGKGTAALISLVTDSPLLIYPLSTLLCTEIMGWGWLEAATAYMKRHPFSEEEKGSFNLKWLLAAFVIIIVVRLVLLLAGHDLSDSRNVLVGVLLDYVFSCAALVWVAEYAIKNHQKARLSEMEANLAQYRYMKLKQQVNPHFLFNCLNILDCLIQEQNTEKASAYTHKLAEIYRYMLGNDDKQIVSLREEMRFVSQYVDLLKVRWPEGLEFRMEIAPEHMDRPVVPCSLQLLIENATKHNAVHPDRKLTISIHSTDKSLVVSNNRCPKLNAPASTGIGLSYLRKQYRDLGDKTIIIRSTDESFTVILPFL